MIYEFATLPTDKVTAVGGKGGTLARLFQAGYPVPDGFVIAPEAFVHESLRDDAWETVQRQLTVLRNGHGTPFAIRSSAFSEDSAHASFAGEFESVLDVQHDAEIRHAIHAVRQSGQNERVQAYSQAQGLNASHQVAVVVQKMVPAEMAGVLFTADPVSGSHAHMTGNFVRGLGDKLVSGEATPDTFTLSRPKGAYAGPPEMKRYGRALFKLAQRLENELHGPQDIEWAVADGKVYLLQARPITTMQPHNPATGEWNDSLRGDYLWTNANFGEAVPDVMTPMTWSLLQLYGREAFTIPLPGQHPLFGNIGGRFYMNASLAASMFTALGYSQERIAAQMREFFGYLPADTAVPLIPFSRWAVLRALLKSAPAAIRRVRRDRKRLAAATAVMPQQAAEFQARIAAAETPADLLPVWWELEAALREACQLLQAGTGLFEDLVRPLRQKLVKWTDEETANTLLSGFSQGSDQLASLGPVIGLWRVQQGQMDEAAYLQQYGHRSAHEFELAWPRPYEEPDWLAQQQANLAAVDVPALLARQEAGKAAAWARFAQQQPRRVAKMQTQLAQVAAAARNREAIRSEIIRLVGVVRQFALRAAELTGLGDTVFFLRLEEMAAVLGGDRTAEAIASTAVTHIPIRQQAHERLSALPVYPGIIHGRFDPYHWQQEADLTGLGDLSGLITGFPGAAGVVEGVVRRLDAPEQGHLLQPGEILVTATTNIGWTPLFPKAGAVVTDVGAPLSHAAIVARELGIPAVVGTGDATARLQTGDWVRVNGAKGVVEKL
ncbi:MAG: pyruvate, phosphate dikinase [Anaerolineae bacterium]|nr:pyruvate, phosphate dikinase [Anaerolineae bacterium]